MAGLLDDDLSGMAIRTGLLSALAGAAGSAGQNWGRVIGNSLSSGLAGYQGTYDNAYQRKLMEQRLAQQEQENSMKQQEFDMRRNQFQQQSEQQKAQQEFLNQYVSQLPPEQQAAVRAFPKIGEDIIKQQFSPQEIKAYRPGDVLYQGGKRLDAIPEAIDYNKPFLPDGSPNVAYQKFKLTDSKASADNSTVLVGTDKKYGEILGTKLAEQDAATIDAARSAPSRLENARRIKQVLQSNPITGTAAEWRLGATKALSTAGVIDGTQVKSTEDLASLLAQGTLDAIKTSGLGGGQGFTDKDRQFLEKARSGNIEINAGTLKMLADLNEKAATASIERGNRVIDQIKSDPNSGDIGKRLEKVEVPSVPIPQGAINALKMNPKLRNDFDAKFGQGAAARVLGK